MNASQGEGYNFIYSKLVEDPDDILGIIAYSFYKQQKIEFIKAFIDQEKRSPTDEELRVFYVTSNSPASITSYRTKAEVLSREFIDAVVGEQIQEIQRASDEELTKRIKSLKSNFWPGVAQNVFSSLLFVILIGAILFVAWSTKYGASQAIEQVTGYQIQERSPSPPQKAEPRGEP